jgi:hypothetical protein
LNELDYLLINCEKFWESGEIDAFFCKFL